MAAPAFEESVPVPGNMHGSMPNTPAFPPTALYQPNSRRVSRGDFPAEYQYDYAEPLSPASPSALPALPPTPGFPPPGFTNDMDDDAAQGEARTNADQHAAQAHVDAPQQHDFEEEGAGGTTSPEWSPAHPCFPHPNPHVPLSSPLYDTTRIIRIPRDWMAAGDLYPAFSTTYPEILMPWVSEDNFRSLVNQVNDALRRAFEPATTRAVLEGVLGLFSGWLLEDAGVIGPQKRVQYVEAIIDNWNAQHLRDVRAVGNRYGDAPADGSDLVAIVPLRRTAYMSLDIQIPDPKITVMGDSDSHASGRSAEGEEADDGGDDADDVREAEKA